MKCMISSDGTHVLRVSDDEASKLYHNENFKYVAKSVWKEKTRDVNKEPALNEDTGETEMVSKKSNEMSKAQKRHARKSNK